MQTHPRTRPRAQAPMQLAPSTHPHPPPQKHRCETRPCQGVCATPPRALRQRCLLTPDPGGAQPPPFPGIPQPYRPILPASPGAASASPRAEPPFTAPKTFQN